jgi:ParB-like chromosome segregation protein Spo0J
MTASPSRPSRHGGHRRRTRHAENPSANARFDEGDRPHIAPALQALAVPIESVELHPRNPRIGDVEAVARSLHRFGQQKPIVIQASTMFCVAGNHLLRAANSLGWTEIAANVEVMDDATATAYMLADNRTADLGSYDDDLLAAILAEQAAGDNLAATGYDPDDVAEFLRAVGHADDRDPSAVPDLPPEAEVYVGAGELWALGRHRLLVGDATQKEAVARLTVDEPVDLIFIDPPYGVGYVGKTRAASHLGVARVARQVKERRTSWAVSFSAGACHWEAQRNPGRSSGAGRTPMQPRMTARRLSIAGRD